MPATIPTLILLLQPNSATALANSAPVLSASPMTFNEDTPTTLTLNYTDAAGDPANWVTLTQIGTPANITLELNTPSDGQIRVTPTENWNGSTSFTVTVEDSEGNTSNQLTVNVTVTAVNDTPVLSTDSFSTDEDTNYDLDVAALYADVEDDAPDWTTLEATVSPGKGTLQLNTPSDGYIRYVPTANQNGGDTFSIRVEDENGGVSNVAEITVTINAVADNPVLASPIAFNFNEGVNGTLDIDASYTSADGTARRTTSGSIVATSPTYGSLSIDQSTGVITYTAFDENWNGSDTFDVYVFDANDLQSNTATVNVTVAAINDAPAVFNYQTDTFQNNAIVIPLSALHLALDIDDAVDWTTVEIGTDATYGDVSVNGSTGDITYLPDTNNTTSDSFTWRVQDATGAWSAYATITIDVLASPILQALQSLDAYAIYRLNETSSTFADSSGNSHSAGSATGTINYAQGTPASNQRGIAPDGQPVISITDSTSYINIVDSDVSGAVGGANFSIAILARDTDANWSSGGTRQLFQIRENTGNEFHTIQVLSSGAPQWFNTINANSQNASGSALAADNSWYWFAESFDDAADLLRYLQNATQVATDTQTNSPSVDAPNTAVRIGNASTSSNGMYLAYFALWNDRTLTTSDMSTLVNAWSNRYQYASLRHLGALNGVHIGVSLPNTYASKSAGFKAVAEGDFSLVTTENAPKYSTLYFSGLGSPNWTPLEDIVNAAEAAGLPHNLHTLFWHGDDSYIDNEIADTKAAAQAEITRRLSELRDKYDTEGWSEPYAIDVCNEIILTSDPGNSDYLRTTHQWSAKFNDSGTTGTQASAYEWIQYCFTETAKYFPNSLLILADFRNERESHWKGDAFYDLLDRLNTDGIPVDGVHFQGHFEHYPSAKWLYNDAIVTQITRVKSLTNYRGKAMYVGWSELDVKMTSYAGDVTANAAGSTGSTLDTSQNIFESAMVNIYTVANLTDTATRTITGYTDANTVTVNSAINDTWDNDAIALRIEITGTADAASTGSTLETSSTILDTDMSGYSVLNTTDWDVRYFTGVTDTNTATVNAAINNDWDGDSITIGTNALWYQVVRETASLVDAFIFWNVTADTSWLGTVSDTTLRKADNSKQPAWTYVAKALLDASEA